MALDGTSEVRVVRRAIDELDITDGALAAAEVAGPFRLDGDCVELLDARHRSAWVQAVTPSRRRQIHRALAHALTEPCHRAARAEHLALSAVGPDDEACSAFAALADEASARGKQDDAAALFRRAGALAPEPEQRARLLYLAADAYWNATDYAQARSAFDAAYAGSADPRLRADVVWQASELDLYERGPRHARDLLVTEAAAVEPHDVDRAARLLVHAAGTALLSSDVVGALPLARRAGEIGGDSTNGPAASLMTAYLSLLHGDHDEFSTRFEDVEPIALALKDTDAPEVDLFLQLVGMIDVYTERWATGRAYLGAVVHRAGRRRRTTTAALAQATLAELCWRSGRWDEAWELVTSRLVTDVKLPGARLWLLAFTAHLEAGFGRIDQCRANANASLAGGEEMGLTIAVMWARSALGLLELGLGRPDAAASHLDRVAAIAVACGVMNPSALWWQADHVEALTRSGRRREAAAALERFDTAARSSGATWPLASVARCRALLGPQREAERCFAEAVARYTALPAPFELARTLVCRAEARMHAGAESGASADAEEAAAIFEALGAAAWSDRAGALRRDLGRRAEPGGADLLTPSERRVAEAVALGLRNREVAARLYISEKTVEFHLRNAYRKLGVDSRIRLARRLNVVPPG